ncbi:uncharacterized protein LOC117179068 isoform X2 [Belonocnema kinseyi]|uniref:uncharacterized protein LOC117179068 isoform X2 n=1 Tax=Belonocnema kinseyi TaxID=2817044 RepID=UPI00143D0DAA|nr:uncharacterized protein LOC117179068 isoform X2 [Belonocnema kinseyi]
MAQHFNISIEDVSRIYSVEGQSVQLFVNNGGNGASPIIYTVPQNNQQIFSHQAINLASQIATAPLDQRSNVYIIKTSEATAAQNIIKSNPVGTHLVAENVVNLIETKETKSSGNNAAQEAQQSQWVNVQESKVATESVLKPAALAKTQAKSQQQNLSTILLQTQGHCSQPDLPVYGSMEKKTVRHYVGKAKGLGISPQGVPRLTTVNQDQVVNPATRVVQSSITRPRLTLPNDNTSSSPLSRGMRAVQACNSTPRSSAPILQRSLGQNQNTSLNSTDMDQLSERIKREKLKQVHAKEQQQQQEKPLYRTPSKVTPIITQRPMAGQRGQFQQRQTTPRLQGPGLMTPRQVQNRMATPKQQQQQQQQHGLVVNPGRVDQRRVVVSSSPVRQKTPVVSPQRKVTTSLSLSSSTSSSSSSMQQQQQPGELNVQVIHAEPAEIQEKIISGRVTQQQSCTPKSETESNSSESYAYLQRVIENPASAIVQEQIKGNVAKMLVVLLDGEQRLITFDIPAEDCTVQDLLEQVNVPFGTENVVSLVNDPTLGINYIVEVHSADSDQNDPKHVSEDSARNPVRSSSPRFACDENSNSSTTQVEEQRFVEGKLAVCTFCGVLSSTFNQCERCKRKFPENVKIVLDSGSTQGTKDNANSCDNYWKKENNTFLKTEKVEKESTVNRARSRPKGRPATKKLVKEPECLIISSDEEHENEKSAKFEKSAHRNCMETEEGMNPEELGIILKKEPVITNQSATTTEGIEGGDKESDDQITGNPTDSLHTALFCRTVRIGSYKYIPAEHVIMSEHGLRLNVPFLEDNKKLVTVDIKFRDIIRVLIHFGKSMPVLFFYTSTNTGAMIREVLGMQDPKGPYYDPASQDHTHKRITLLPETISAESTVILKTLFESKYQELNPKEANDILVRASPKDCLQQVLSRRQSAQPATPSSANGEIQQLMVYPPKGGIAINTEDYSCLGEDQFLNDVIIDFYLKYLTSEILSEVDRNRTHVFSSFFYKRLTTPNAPTCADKKDDKKALTAAEKRHERVKKWTKNVNIFEKDFIVIPINEHAHWFLAIVCFPGLVGKVAPKSTNAKESEAYKNVHKNKKAKEVKEEKLQAFTIANTTITPVTTKPQTSTITIVEEGDGSERDEAEGDDEEMEMDTDDDEDYEEEGTPSKQPKVAPPRQIQEKEERLPCILIFDSLAGASRSRVVATLRDYLSCEHKAKHKGTEKVFSKDTIKGACPKVPQQSNFTDCGVYVLQYVESFFKEPVKNYTLPIKTLKNWFEEIVVTRKREEISNLLIELMKRTNGSQNISLPSVIFPTQDGKLKPKSEPEKSKKEEVKKTKTEVEGKTSAASTTPAENSESPEQKVLPEVTGRTIQIIPYSSTSSSSSSSTEGNVPEMSIEAIPPIRSSAETMHYLKSKRIQRIVMKSDSSDDKPAAKKLKSDSADSCK